MGVQQEKGRQFAHYRGAYQSWAEITIIRILLEVRWIAEVHAFGRFFKVGVEGQQWQMPGLRAQDKPRHKGSAAAHVVPSKGKAGWRGLAAWSSLWT
jgi:hypothetical protein